MTSGGIVRRISFLILFLQISDIGAIPSFARRYIPTEAVSFWTCPERNNFCKKTRSHQCSLDEHCQSPGSRCCYDGCSMVCVDSSKLVMKHKCKVLENGQVYKPDEVYIYHCIKCICGSSGYPVLCERISCGGTIHKSAYLDNGVSNSDSKADRKVYSTDSVGSVMDSIVSLFSSMFSPGTIPQHKKQNRTAS